MPQVLARLLCCVLDGTGLQTYSWTILFRLYTITLQVSLATVCWMFAASQHAYDSQLLLC
jgi:hypothetical protein